MTFELLFDWDEAPGVAAPELKATWAQLQIRVGDRSATAVESETGVLRRSIHVPLYPLAEWIAYNWWFLCHNQRPRGLRDRDLSMSARLLRPGADSSWVTNHNLRAIGEGFAWPDLTLVPGEGSHLVVWQGDPTRIPHSRVRFSTSGRAEVDSESLISALAGLVETVTARLIELDERDHPLLAEWQWVKSVEADEADFCVAAARLGIDPADVSDEIADTVVEIGDRLSTQLLDDFLDAASSQSLANDLAWVLESRSLIEASDLTTERLPKLSATSVPNQRPWLLGQRDAVRVRSELGLESVERVSLDPFVALLPRDPASRGIEALGGKSQMGGSTVSLGRQRTEAAQRFAAARAAWRFARGEGEFLLTSTRTRLQKAERAFAAELTAPAEGIRELLGFVEDGAVSLDEVGEISDHFGVNEWVVEYQIENQLELDVADPELLRS